MAISACVVSGDVGALTGTDATPSSTSTGSSSSEASTADAEKLDVASRDLPTTECHSVSAETTIEIGPSDIIVVVDREMSDAEMESIFRNFSQAIGNDGIDDVQVITIAGYPPDGVCIDEPPLGIGECPTNDDNPPLHRRVEETIEAPTLLAQLLDTAPTWSPWIRPDAHTHVWVLARRDANLSTAAFDADFSQLVDGYTFHAIAPEGPEDTGDCGAVEPGASWAPAPQYASLVESTDGVFEDACNFNVGTLFERLLDRIHETALSCEYDIPPPPDGLVFEKGKVNVQYDDVAGPHTVGFVEDPQDCVDFEDGWHYDDAVDPQRILMCPQTCARFEALSDASIEIVFGCTTIPAA